MAEPDGALTYGDLILRVAKFLGVAYYGAAGDEVAQVPVDAFTLDLCKEHVQDGIRRFIADKPPEGWRWQRPIAEIALWADVAVDADVTVSGGVYADGVTTLTASEDAFFASMEAKSIIVTGVGTFPIATYSSATAVIVTGDASSASADTFSIAHGGTFTLPATFGGEYAGGISYSAGSNLGAYIGWGTELEIRRFRENQDDSSGYPFIAAVRRTQSNSRRWELVVYPTPSGDWTVEFPYVIYFDEISALTDLHPAGFAHDETVRAAVLAAAEEDSDDVVSTRMNTYRQIMLPSSYRTDARSAPRRLGYCGNSRNERIRLRDVRQFIRRPTVTY